MAVRNTPRGQGMRAHIQNTLPQAQPSGATLPKENDSKKKLHITQQQEKRIIPTFTLPALRKKNS